MGSVSVGNIPTKVLPNSPSGEEAIELGLVTRQDLFVTSKLWVTENHPHLVLPALRKSLQTLQLDYLDLYLIHWPLASQPGKFSFPIPVEDLLPLNRTIKNRTLHHGS